MATQVDINSNTSVTCPQTSYFVSAIVTGTSLDGQSFLEFQLTKCVKSRRTNRLLPFVISASCLTFASNSHAEPKTTINMQNDSQRALAELRASLSTQPRWIKVHAAEALIGAGHAAEARNVFLTEWKKSKDEPEYRIGIMRVLARSSSDETDRLEWTNRIKSAFFDGTGTDRIHAAESLAKLRVTLNPNESEKAEENLTSSNSALAVNTCWALAASGSIRHTKLLEQFLDSHILDSRLVAAYAMARLPVVSAAGGQRLSQAASIEQPDTTNYMFMTSAAFTVAAKQGNTKEIDRCRIELNKGLRAVSPPDRREACNAFAAAGTKADAAIVGELLEDSDPDVRVSAAAAILQIDQRSRVSKQER
jgi:hypothetical protein